MGIDYSVALECDVKRKFGDGDASRGAAAIEECLKAKGRAATISDLARQSGQDPAEISVALHVYDRNGNPVEREVTIAELEAEAAALEGSGGACKACAANFRGEPYGCFGFMNYPIPAEAENWLIERLQPPGTIGAKLCLDFMNEFGVRGTAVRQMRGAGMFESSKGRKVVFKKGFFRSVSVSADQLLETIFHVGDRLNPGHIFGILIWLGAIQVDGKVPGGMDDQPRIRKLAALKAREDKERHTKLELGPPPSSEEVEAFQRLVKALYLAWVLDVEVTMSA